MNPATTDLGFQGKHVVVTGCYSGIGQATTELLQSQGARVCGLDIRTPAIPPSQFIPVDFLQRQSLDKAISEISEPIHALFNCAGLAPSHADDNILTVNFFATRYLTQQLIERMPEGSAIVNVGSIGGSGWLKNLPKLLEFLALEDDELARQWYSKHSHIANDAYCFSKEAIAAWTKQLSIHLITRGIRINCTAPGATQTPMLSEIEQNLPDSNVDRVTQPIGRRSTPAEQAWALIMLNSPLASYINGVDLAVDGGAASMQLLSNIKPD